VGGKFCHSKFFAALTAASNKRFEFVTEKRTRNAGVPIAYAASVSPSLRIAVFARSIKFLSTRWVMIASLMNAMAAD
jgi:hypothetical protein